MNVNRPLLIPLMIAISLLLLVSALYGVTLHFPFYSDDVPTFAYVPTIALADVWTDTGVFGTWFRPLPYTLYWLQWPAWAYYLLVLLTHLVNSALVGRLALALRLGRAGSLVSMAVFALLPFNAQAAMWITSYVHPLTTLLALSAAICAVYALRRRSNRWTLAALVALVAAPFAHESGVTAPALVGMSLWLALGWWGLVARWRRLLLIMAASVGAALAFWLIRGSMVAGDAGLGAVYVIDNWPFVLQWWTFPAQMLAALLPLAPLTQVIVGAGLAGALLLLIVVWRGDWRLVVFGAGWMVAAAAPALAFLHPNYLIWSERVLYLSGAGLALLIGGVLARLPRRLTVSIGAGLALLCTALIVPYRADMIAHDQMSDDLLALYANDDDTPAPATLLLNLPSYSERTDALLPLSAVRAFMLSDWIELADFITVNTGRDAGTVRAVQQFNLQAGWPQRDVSYFGAQIELAGLPAAIAESARFAQSAYDAGWQLRLGGERFAVESAARWRFGDDLALHAAQATYDGQRVTVALDWQRLNADAPLPQVAFVHLLCDGQMVAQVDGSPLFDLYPFDVWQADEAWREYRYLDGGAHDAACLRVRVGLYDRVTGARLSLFEGDTPQADDFLTLTINPASARD